jgi:hypothetical protein
MMEVRVLSRSRINRITPKRKESPLSIFFLGLFYFQRGALEEVRASGHSSRGIIVKRKRAFNFLFRAISFSARSAGGSPRQRTVLTWNNREKKACFQFSFQGYFIFSAERWRKSALADSPLANNREKKAAFNFRFGVIIYRVDGLQSPAF